MYPHEHTLNWHVRTQSYCHIRLLLSVLHRLASSNSLLEANTRAAMLRMSPMYVRGRYGVGLSRGSPLGNTPVASRRLREAPPTPVGPSPSDYCVFPLLPDMIG